jgi:hypothetical protein
MREPSQFSFSPVPSVVNFLTLCLAWYVDFSSGKPTPTLFAHSAKPWVRRSAVGI